LAFTILVCATEVTADADVVPVSLAPVANEFQYRLVNPPIGMVTLGGVPFAIPTSGNNAWSAHIGTTIGVQSTTAMELPMNVYGAKAVDTLINLGWGDTGTKLVTATFLGTGGANYSVELETGTDIRNWLDTPYCCNTINGTTTTQVWEGDATQYAGIARIDKQRITLPASFATQTLTKFILTDNGISGDVTNTIYDNSHAQRSLIYGFTVTTVPEPTTALLLMLGTIGVARRRQH
jgi:PEP-CTERM motif-containing protein